MKVSQVKSLFSAFRDLYIFSPPGVIVNLLLTLAHGVTAGMGILLLLPMLSFIGLQDATLANSKMTEMVEHFFLFLGVELNLLTILILYVLILSSVALVQYALVVQVSKIQQRIICYFRDQFHQQLLKSSWQFIVDNKMSRFGQALTLQIQSMGTVFQHLLLLISQLVMIFVYVVLALYLSWEISLLAFSCAAILFFLIMPFNQKIFIAGENRLLGFNDIFHIIGEQLDSIKIIKSFSAERIFANQLSKAGHRLEKQVVNANSAKARSKLIFSIVSVLFISAIFYVSVVWLNITISTLLLMLFIFSRLLPNIASLLNTIHQLLFELPAVKGVKELISLCEKNAEKGLSTPRDSISESADTRKLTENDQVIDAQFFDSYCSIEFKNVSYVYPEKNNYAIENRSFKINANQTTVFAGPSGAGKTTAADLLVGLLVPTEGEITINYAPVNNVIAGMADLGKAAMKKSIGKQNSAVSKIVLGSEHIMLWRKQVAYVTQELHLFHLSVRDNLNWVNEGVTEEEIWAALQQASAKDFVERLPQGLDTMVGDKGVRISGGERQRLALARALLSKPKVLVLDEATSALDDENERKIIEALDNLKGKLTIVIVAHRKSSISHADKVIYFDTNSLGKIQQLNV